MKKKSMLDLHRVDADEYRRIEKLPLAVVLDDVRSEMNVGSVFRTADAFLVERICLCGITSQPPRPEIHKTALGAEDTVAWSYHRNAVDAVRELRDEGYRVCAVEQVHGSVPLNEFVTKNDEKIAIVFGNEVKGVSQEVVDMCDCCIEIPQFGTKHSLNIANSAAIVIWHLFNNMKTL